MDEQKSYERKRKAPPPRPEIFLPLSSAPICENLTLVTEENEIKFEDKVIQVDNERSEEIRLLEAQITDLTKEVKRLQLSTVSERYLAWTTADSERLKYYVGFSVEEFEIIWDFLGMARDCLALYKSHGSARVQKVKPKEQYLLTLLKLRQDYTFTDLAYKFEISVPHCSRIFVTWIQFLYKKFGEFRDDMYVERHEHKPLPWVFRNDLLRDTRIVLDCTEILCESSTDYKQQGNMFSNYKSHTTVKILLGTAPSGACMFVSECYEGNISDKQIVIKSGVLNKLKEGDAVLGDRGFCIHELCREKGAKLVIPAFRFQKSQSSVEESVETKLIAQARVHIERYNERIKNFRILQGIIPLSLFPMISQIVFVLCCFVNFQEPLCN